MRKMCDLCDLVNHKTQTPVIFEDHICVLVNCRSCHVPMTVLKRHTGYPTEEERVHMVKKTQGLFPNRVLDFQMRSLPEHYHVHAR